MSTFLHTDVRRGQDGVWAGMWWWVRIKCASPMDPFKEGSACVLSLDACIAFECFEESLVFEGGSWVWACCVASVLFVSLLTHVSMDEHALERPEQIKGVHVVEHHEL